MVTRPGFWRLEHDHLEALLARRDLFAHHGEAVRVYLAIADLTHGYGKDADILALAAIANAAGMGRPQVARALKTLAAAGLYGQDRLSARRVVRWVVWPPPPAPPAPSRPDVPICAAVAAEPPQTPAPAEIAAQGPAGPATDAGVTVGEISQALNTLITPPADGGARANTPADADVGACANTGGRACATEVGGASATPQEVPSQPKEATPTPADPFIIFWALWPHDEKKRQQRSPREEEGARHEWHAQGLDAHAAQVCRWLLMATASIAAKQAASAKRLPSPDRWLRSAPWRSSRPLRLYPAEAKRFDLVLAFSFVLTADEQAPYLLAAERSAEARRGTAVFRRCHAAALWAADQQKESRRP